MPEAKTIDRRSPLWEQLTWFIRLRWVAGLIVMIGAPVDAIWLSQFNRPVPLACVGAAILLYNVVLRAALPYLPSHRVHPRALDLFAGLQIALDVVCLTLLTIWTGGVRSPILGFFVFHMVFASLLLPRSFAYGSVAFTVILLASALGLSGQWPGDHTAELTLAGWVVTLLFTVYLTSRITQRLRHQRQRLVRQNRRIRRMGRRLRRQQQAMIQQEKMSAMGQMAAGVAHEVANPLASMDSLLQLMQRMPDKQRPGAIDTLREQIARIKTTLTQMNSFARGDGGVQEQADVNAIIDRALSMMRFDHRMRHVTIDKQLDPDAGVVQVRAQAIEQVVVNLLINALDALADTQDARVTLRTEGCGADVVITVIDNGPGIPTEKLRRIFEPFFTTKPAGKGTGLGLSISYTLVASHNGTLTANTLDAGGAAFILTLPRLPAASRDREAPGTANPEHENQDN